MRSLLLKRVRLLMLVVGVVVGALVTGSLLIDEGELVMLVTTDDELHHRETRLWVADVDGEVFLRASTPRVGWLERVKARPRVQLERGDSSVAYHVHVVDDPAMRDRVNRVMAEKYGFADQVWGRISNRRAAVAIRLDPVPADEAAVHSQAGTH